MASVAQKITYNMRKEIVEKFDRLPLNFFDNRSSGDILSRVTNDVDTIGNTLNQSLSSIITSTIILIGTLYIMLLISIPMTLVALLTMPASFIFIKIVVGASQKYFKQQQKILGQLNGHIEEIYSGHSVVTAYGGEDIAIDKFKKYNNNLYDSARKSQFLSGLMMPIIAFIGNIGYVFVCVLGGYLVVSNKVQIGGVQAFIQYLRQLNHPTAQVASIFNVLQSTAAAAERVFEFLEEEIEIETKTKEMKKDFSHNIKFSNLNFSYNNKTDVIKNFSVNIQKGSKIAIVGPTGAGKTTIVNLLMRFYDINSGSILIDNENILDFDRKDLRDLFGMVLQDAWVYNGSIRENILFGNKNATEKQFNEACQLSLVDVFIKTLPNGYDFILNEDTNNISTGQKQLITIARAILKNPKILILDEATSSVDTRSEILISKAMNNLMENRTSFIIAHRLSTIKESDIILVMKEGNIVEQGNHFELMSQRGFYYELHNLNYSEA
jgi:ATP-binding cassette subfamily B protein